MRKTRWAWFLLAAVIGTVSAEGLSWSTPIIVISPLVIVIYGLHYLLILDFLARRQALTLRALAVGGFVVGITTESLMTKVIWNPPWDEGEVTRIAGLGVFEVGFIVMVWHAWMSMAFPFALSLTYFGHAQVVDERTARRILKFLPLTMFFGASVQPPELLVQALLGIPLNALLILGAAWLYRRASRRTPMLSIRDMALTRRERVIVWGLLLAFYALFIPWRAEAYPSVGPFLLGMGLLVGSLVLLVAVGRADAGRTALPDTSGRLHYTPRAFRRYVWRYALASIPLVAVGVILRPVTSVVAIGSVLLLIVIGDAYMLRLAWRARRAWRRQVHTLSGPTVA